jgi:hypothetical protein
MDTMGLAWLAGWQTRAPRPNAKLICMRVEGWQAGGVAGSPAKRRAAERERERERKREREREREREKESSRKGNAALVGLTFPSLGSSPGSKGSGGCGPTSQRAEREKERERERERKRGRKEGEGGIRHPP